jgi:hypothetical protein
VRCKAFSRFHCTTTDCNSFHRLQINQAAFVTYAWDAFVIGSMLMKIGNLLDNDGAVVSGGDMEWSETSTLLPASSPALAIMPSTHGEASTQVVPLQQTMASNPSSGQQHARKWNQDGWEG